MYSNNKYHKLEEFFKSSNDNIMLLSFSKIEEILGFELPPSAYKHSAFWSNTSSHSISFSWINAGYKSKNTNMQNQTVEFQKEICSNLKTKHNTKIASKEKQKNDSFPVELAVKNIYDYFNETIKDEHGRYMSWRHCYNAFYNNRNIINEQTLDYLALNLAFYLASWGMYRGSSFLLQKDYKVHIPIIRIIQEEKYNELLGISAEDLCKEKNISLIQDISNRIKECYKKEKPSKKGCFNNASDTLVTKILLGTLGCAPAYDRFYINAVKKNNISSGIYNKESVRSIAKYYCDNFEVFEKVRNELSRCGTEYPPMKLMDMCFWQDAYIYDLEQKKNKHKGK